MSSDLARYQNVVFKHGPGSPAAKQFKARYKSDRRFLRRAQMLDLLFKSSKQVRQFVASHRREPA